MNSIWSENVSRSEYGSLNGDIQKDVVIIGGGITGILCAYMLEKQGVDYVLIEADKICCGITNNTTAKVTIGHSLIYHQIFLKYGKDITKLYLEANLDALSEYKKICSNIDCDLKSENSYVYTLDNIEQINKEIEILNMLGYGVNFKKDLPLPLAVQGSIEFEKQLSLNPLKFLYSIAANLNIFEKTRALQIKNNIVITEKGNIKAKKIIVATHFPFINTKGNYFIKMYQHRSYVIAIKTKEKLTDMYIDSNPNGLSFRSYNDYLLIGGASHRTGKKGRGWSELIEFADFSYPEYQFVSKWATQDCMTLDGIPYIGRYSNNTPDLFVATGFNKWGMTSSMVAAKMLKDLICEKENIYESVFSPSRSVMHSQLFFNVLETAINFITPTFPRCPHMGCALKYNKYEHSWDCPCHGSRFTKDKKLIDNPSKKDI